MSRLVARILLCVLMFPLAVVVYCSIMLNLDRLNPWQWSYPYSEIFSFLTAGLGTLAFVVVYWSMLWRKAIQWTLRRRLAAVASASVGVIILAIAQWILTDSGDWQVKIVLLDILIPALWLISTVYYWQETPAERAGRLGASGRENISCPTCGYNLTGLTEARCPECGTKFTLDELLAAQPGQAVAEIE